LIVDKDRILKTSLGRIAQRHATEPRWNIALNQQAHHVTAALDHHADFITLVVKVINLKIITGKALWLDQIAKASQIKFKAVG